MVILGANFITIPGGASEYLPVTHAGVAARSRSQLSDPGHEVCL